MFLDTVGIDPLQFSLLYVIYDRLRPERTRYPVTVLVLLFGMKLVENTDNI